MSRPNKNVVELSLPTALSEADAAIVKGMIERGDRQHDIAAWFGVNSGRVADISTGKKHADIPSAPAHSLPPSGPSSYFTERPDMSLPEQVRQSMAGLDLKWAQALSSIRQELREAIQERRSARAEARQLNEKLDMLLRQNLDLRRELRVVETPVAPRPSRRDPIA